MQLKYNMYVIVFFFGINIKFFFLGFANLKMWFENQRNNHLKFINSRGKEEFKKLIFFSCIIFLNLI